MCVKYSQKKSKHRCFPWQISVTRTCTHHTVARDLRAPHSFCKKFVNSHGEAVGREAVEATGQEKLRKNCVVHAKTVQLCGVCKYKLRYIDVVIQ